jgi:hypothetical protein
MGDRLGIDAAGGFDQAHLGEQGGEFIQRAEMRRVLLQDGDEGELRVLTPVERREQDGAFDGLSCASSCASRASCARRGAQPSSFRHAAGEADSLELRVSFCPAVRSRMVTTYTMPERFARPDRDAGFMILKLCEFSTPCGGGTAPRLAKTNCLPSQGHG